jgi:hypothetical protein
MASSAWRAAEPTYLFWLRRDDATESAAPFAVVAISFKPGNADADLRRFPSCRRWSGPASNACGASCRRATRS